jgi:hypothetical protein
LERQLQLYIRGLAMSRLQMLVYSLSTPETDAFGRAAAQARVDVVRTADSAIACEWLDSRKFDGVIVDSDTPGAASVLHGMMLSKSNSKAASLSIVSSEDRNREIIRTPTDLKVWKGVNTLAVTNAFKVLYVSMVAERQRYFRCPVDILVRFRKEDSLDETYVAHAFNVSRGGMAMTAINVEKGDWLTLEFRLAKDEPLIRTSAEVLRSNDSIKRTAVRFIDMSDSARAALQDWLSNQCVLSLAENDAESRQDARGSASAAKHAAALR